MNLLKLKNDLVTHIEDFFMLRCYYKSRWRVYLDMANRVSGIGMGCVGCWYSERSFFISEI